jgi:hypothetical protein
VVRLELDRLVAVIAADALVIADRGGEVAQDGRVHGGVLRVGAGVGGAGAARRAKGPDLAPQAVGEDVLELGECASARLLDARDPGGGLQPDGDGDRLVVVE